jgi:hypothetical protein
MNYLANSDVSEEIDGRETDPLTGNIIGAAIDVHRALGPGLLESAYEACLVYELRACSKSVIRMLCCYKSAINSQKFFGILNNIAKNFCEFIANFSKQIIRSKILNRL